jgi:hypothetical protein
MTRWLWPARQMREFFSPFSIALPKPAGHARWLLGGVVSFNFQLPWLFTVRWREAAIYLYFITGVAHRRTRALGYGQRDRYAQKGVFQFKRRRSC